MQWFKVEKVLKETETETEESGVYVDWRTGEVMDKADISFYKLADYDSWIKIYAMSNYFIAKQYMVRYVPMEKTFYAEYHLTLTDEAWKIVNALLNAPFIYDVKYGRTRAGTLHYKCSTQHSAYIPHLTKAKLEKGAWVIGMLPYPIPRIATYRSYTTIPFNCGPLRPLWERAVECWIEKIRELGSKHVAKIKDALLRYKFLDTYIVPVYPL